MSPRRLFDELALCVVLTTLAGWLGVWWWPLQNLAVFGPHQAALPAIAAAVWAARRKWLWAAGALLLAGICAAPHAHYYLAAGSGTADASRPAFRVVVLNLDRDSDAHERALQFMRQADADVLVLAEVDGCWHAALRPLHDLYPHRTESPRPDDFGIALYSRIAPRHSEIHVLRIGHPTAARATAPRLDRHP